MRELVRTLPDHEKYRLADQITRCSRSVTNNIAEGYGRFHYLENAKFCRISRGSLYELLDHLFIAQEEGFITKIQTDELKREIAGCAIILKGYIKYLTKRNSSNV